MPLMSFQKNHKAVLPNRLRESVLETIRDPSFRNEAEPELAEALKLIRPIRTTTRDGELERILKKVEQHPRSD
jgi:hypothetical protein